MAVLIAYCFGAKLANNDSLLTNFVPNIVIYETKCAYRIGHFDCYGFCSHAFGWLLIVITSDTYSYILIACLSRLSFYLP